MCAFSLISLKSVTQNNGCTVHVTMGMRECSCSDILRVETVEFFICGTHALHRQVENRKIQNLCTLNPLSELYTQSVSEHFIQSFTHCLEVK